MCLAECPAPTCELGVWGKSCGVHNRHGPQGPASRPAGPHPTSERPTSQVAGCCLPGSLRLRWLQLAQNQPPPKAPFLGPVQEVGVGVKD